MLQLIVFYVFWQTFICNLIKIIAHLLYNANRIYTPYKHTYLSMHTVHKPKAHYCVVEVFIYHGYMIILTEDEKLFFINVIKIRTLL